MLHRFGGFLRFASARGTADEVADDRFIDERLFDDALRRGDRVFLTAREENRFLRHVEDFSARVRGDADETLVTGVFEVLQKCDDFFRLTAV